jgi:hypothetical protein
MACCLAVALVIAVVRAAWFRLFPAHRPVRAGFAPPARRPAPGPVLSGGMAAGSANPGMGTVVVDRGAVGPEAGVGPSGSCRRLSNRRVSARTGSVLVAGVLGVAGYAATAEVALGTGLVHLAATWLERLVITVAVLTVAAALLARQRRRERGNPLGGSPSDPIGDRTGGGLGPAVGGPAVGGPAVGGPAERVRRAQRRSSGLVAAGAGWSVASVLDMHLLGVLPVGAGHQHGSGDMPGMSAGHGFGPAELVMHGPGLVAVVLGCLLALGAELRRTVPSPLSPRPGRAT